MSTSLMVSSNQWSLFASLLLAVQSFGAEYGLHKVQSEEEGEDIIISPQRAGGVPGLYVGSGLAFKANCVNVDLEGIVDASGLHSQPGELYALVAQEVVLSDTEPRVIYFLQHDSTTPFPFDSGRFRWINSEREYRASERCIINLTTRVSL